MTIHQASSSRATVYLLRHGDIRQDTIKRYIGQMNLSLNEAGRIQASIWRDALAQVPFSRILCSDLARSYEMASIIGEAQTTPVQTLQKLQEINLGAWDGQPIAEVQSLYPGEYKKRGLDLVYYRPPAGECFADVAARVIPLFEEIVRNTEGNLLVVGHAGVNRVILCHLLGMPLSNLLRLGQDYGCLNLIEYGWETFSIKGVNIQPSSFQPAALPR